ncbi:MAG: hypothetical protein LUD17_06850 [Bacteroidales bacterium]|nr:hypothetical protein [Bacteroidales bacterium]
MQRHKIGFFASRRVDYGSVLPMLDWAADVARHEDVTIISGFQSKLEKEALRLLLDGKCGIAMVQLRPVYKQVPELLRPVFDAGRVLFISLSERMHRPTPFDAERRSDYIASVADELVLASLHPGSFLQRLKERGAVIVI